MSINTVESPFISGDKPGTIGHDFISVDLFFSSKLVKHFMTTLILDSYHDLLRSALPTSVVID